MPAGRVRGLIGPSGRPSGTTRLAGLAVSLVSAWLLTHAQSPVEPGSGGFTIGLYKDGQLIETLADVTPPGAAAAATRGLALQGPQAPGAGIPSAAPGLSAETEARNAAFGRTARSAADIEDALGRLATQILPDTGEVRAELAVRLQEFLDATSEARAALDQTGRRIAELQLDPIILDRHAETVAAFEQNLTHFEGLIQDVVADTPGAVQTALAFLEQARFVNRPSLEKASPTVQVHVLQAPELTREEADALLESAMDEAASAAEMTPPPRPAAQAQPASVKPTRVDATATANARSARLAASPSVERTRSRGIALAGGPPPTPADLAPTIDVQITQAIRDKAAALGNSPLAIYDFVRNNVLFQPYLGSRKGSAFTLQQRAGNDTDQASLLLALLRAAGIPSRYVRGSVEMTPQQAMNWLGVEDARTAGSILTTAGLDGLNIVDGGGNVLAIRCTRVWVEAYVPYANYRGVPNDDTGQAWIPLDPAYKGTIITPGEDVLAAMGWNADAFLADYISTFHAASPIEKLQQDIQAWLDVNRPGQTVADIERLIGLDPLELGLLPASLPYQVLSITSRFSELEAAKRYRVRFHLHDGGTTYLDYTANLPDLVGQRLTIEYVGASPTDQATIDAHGGVYQTPPNLVNVKPRLKLDGAAVATSANFSRMGYNHNWDMHFLQPVGEHIQQSIISNKIITGNGQAVAIDTFLDVPLGILGAGNSAGSLLEDTLYQTAAEYLSRVDRGDEKASALMRMVTTQNVSEAIVENSVKVTYSYYGTPLTFEWTGLIVDADRRIVGSFAANGDASRNVPYMKLTGYDGSNMENRVFEDTYAQEAISTIKILELSNDRGIGVCTITSSIAADCPGFSQPSLVATINNALSQGHHVIIPRGPITVGQWSGTGYIDMDPATGAAGYIISGGISGNMSVAGGATVDVWPINLGCAPVGDVTGTITPNGFADGEILCPDASHIKYTVTLQYDCKDAQGRLQHKTFPPTSHTVPHTKKQIVENPNWGPGEYTISIPGTRVTDIHFTLLDVASLRPDKAVEIDDKDNNPDTKTFIVCISSTTGDKVTLTAIPDPALPESRLPACWSLDGGTGSGKLTRTLDQTSADKKILTAKSGARQKKTTVIVLKLELITPAGDPVSAPDDSGDGQNEFTFSTANPGVLTMNLKAHVEPSGVADKIKDKCRFTVASIGNSALAWDASNPGGKPKVSWFGFGNDLEATVRFTGLPANNSDFGLKKAEVHFDTCKQDENKYEVFFPKDGSNHPGGQAASPNWYYYWTQTSANHGTHTYVTTSTSGRSEYEYPGFGAGRGVLLMNDASQTQISAWGTPKGIDCFAWTTGHEAKHESQWRFFWPGGSWIAAQDADRDLFLDSKEPNYMPGRPYDPTKAATYPDTIGYGINPIPDMEDVDMRSQTSPYALDALWTNGNANREDWADPGKNSKNTY